MDIKQKIEAIFDNSNNWEEPGVGWDVPLNWEKAIDQLAALFEREMTPMRECLEWLGEYIYLRGKAIPEYESELMLRRITEVLGLEIEKATESAE